MAWWSLCGYGQEVGVRRCPRAGVIGKRLGVDDLWGHGVVRDAKDLLKNQVDKNEFLILVNGLFSLLLINNFLFCQ